MRLCIILLQTMDVNWTSPVSPERSFITEFLKKNVFQIAPSQKQEHSDRRASALYVTRLPH